MKANGIHSIGTSNGRLSLLAIGFILSVVIVWIVAKHRHYHQPISWDSFGYYLYLPAQFIHDDLAIKDPTWFDALFQRYAPSETVYQLNYMDDGGRAIKYPIGLALLWMPFFFIGHFIAGAIGAPQDGLSSPYQFSIVAGSIIYCAIGLLWLRKVLSHWFTDRVIMCTLLLIAFGTNLLYMWVFQTLMPHAFLFSLYAGIMLFSIRWHAIPNIKDSVLIGFLIGLAASIRNTELIALIIPLMWNAWSGSFRDHLRKLWHFRIYLLIALTVMFITCLPQIIYWKYVTGEFLYMSYTNAGEGLDLHDPHIWNVLFSFRKGLLIYTPIVVIAFTGIFLLRRYARETFPSIPIYLLVNFWIVSSWTIWWYADSFGNRGFVQSYAALCIPLAALVQWSFDRERTLRIALASLATALALLCVFQTWQIGEGILHSSRMTEAAYWKIFGKIDRPSDLEGTLIVQRNYDGSVTVPDLSKYRSVAIDQQDFEDPEDGFPADHYTDPYHHSGNASYRVDAQIPWSRSIGRTFNDLADRDHLYAKYTAYFFIPEGSVHPDATMVIAMQHGEKNYGEVIRDIQQHELIPGKWNKLEAWFVTPTIRNRNDVMRAYVWLRDTTPIWVDDTRLEVFAPIAAASH